MTAFVTGFRKRYARSGKNNNKNAKLTPEPVQMRFVTSCESVTTNVSVVAVVVSTNCCDVWTSVETTATSVVTSSWVATVSVTVDVS